MQTIYVEVTDFTRQLLKSILIEYFVMSVGNPVPTKVTSSPPTTEPNLGVIEVSLGVRAALYVTGALIELVTPSKVILEVQALVSKLLLMASYPFNDTSPTTQEP